MIAQIMNDGIVKTVKEEFEYDEEGRVKKKTITTTERNAFVDPYPQYIDPRDIKITSSGDAK